MTALKTAEKRELLMAEQTVDNLAEQKVSMKGMKKALAKAAKRGMYWVEWLDVMLAGN